MFTVRKLQKSYQYMMYKIMYLNILKKKKIIIIIKVVVVVNT